MDMKISTATGVVVAIGALLLAGIVWFQVRPAATTEEHAALSADRHWTRAPEAVLVMEDKSQPNDSTVQSSRLPDPSWSSRYEQAPNLAQFVKEASEAVAKGDATAAWYVNEALTMCVGVVSAVRKGTDAEAAYMSREIAPERRAERAKRYERCREIGVDEALVTWSLEPGGKMDPRYWRDIALTLGSPMAKADAVITQASALNTPASDVERQKKIATLKGYANEVLRSGAPDALFALGMRLANADMSKDTTHGWALALAACDLGYDCSAGNKRNIWSNCNSSAACPPDRTFRQVVEDTLTPQQYAVAHALAEQYKDDLERGEVNDLDRLVRLDGSSFQSR